MIMKLGLKTLIALLILIALLKIIPAVEANQEQTTLTTAGATVIIVIDGLQQRHLHNAKVPNINGLSHGGTKVNRVAYAPENMAKTVSLLLTGKTETNASALDSFFEAQKRKNIKTIFINGTSEEFDNITSRTSVSENIPFDGTYNIMQKAIKEIEAGKESFCLITMPLVNKNVGSPDKTNLSVIDNQIGLLLHHLHNLNILNQSLVIMTGTTGEPPLFIRGYKIKEQFEIPIASFSDIAATISYIKEQKFSDNGMILYELITQSSAGPLEKRVKDLSTAYAQAVDQIEQMQSQRKNIELQQAKLDKDKAKYIEVIEQQQTENDRLKKINHLYTLSGYTIVIIIGIILYLQYRYLKKRFTFFS